MKCFFDISGHRRLGHVVKFNNVTVLVKFIAGCSTQVFVKRHIKKHNVAFVGE